MKLHLQASSIRATLFTAALIAAPAMWANHPVLVEGNCNNPPFGDSTVRSAGNCGDFDGDNRIGVEEDNDGDRVFGTITAANASRGAADNGIITIVTSGTFAEAVVLAGNVTLQAAPGVHANIDAVLQGDSGSTPRQGVPGIVVNAPANRFVTIRNLTIRNWTSGIQVNGASRVIIENCLIEHNTNYGVEVTGTAKVLVDGSKIVGTGLRVNPATGDFPTSAAPKPGNGINFMGGSTGTVANSTIVGSFGTGVANQTMNGRAVLIEGSTFFDNGEDWSRAQIQPRGANNSAVN